MTVSTERNCVRCGGSLPQPSRSDRRYCSDACRLSAHQERERAARLQGIADTLPDESSEAKLVQLRQAVTEAVREEKLLAVIAADARQGNWMQPTRWGERGSNEPLAFDDDPADPFREFDQLAERRRRKPPGY